MSLSRAMPGAMGGMPMEEEEERSIAKSF